MEAPPLFSTKKNPRGLIQGQGSVNLGQSDTGLDGGMDSYFFSRKERKEGRAPTRPAFCTAFEARNTWRIHPCMGTACVRCADAALLVLYVTDWSLVAHCRGLWTAINAPHPANPRHGQPFGHWVNPRILVEILGGGSPKAPNLHTFLSFHAGR